MRTTIVTNKEALAISNRDEDHFYERKSIAVSGRKIQKAVTAFANADGGELIVGVADNKERPEPEERWVGAANIEQLNAALQNVQEVKPSVDVRYEFLKCSERAGYVLRIQIEKSSDVHQTADGTVYQRHGAQSPQ